MKEMWKNIPKFEGMYQVSSLGRVKNIKKSTDKKHRKTSMHGRILIGKLSNGYRKVSLCNNGDIINEYIHRLVAQAFIPNPENKPEIDHINTVRDDNRVENLRWVTRRENTMNPITLEKTREAARRIGLSRSIESLLPMIEASRKRVRSKEFREYMNKKMKGNTSLKSMFGKSNPKSVSVIQMDLNGNHIKEWESANMAATSLSLHQANISKVCNGKRVSTGGYKWKFKN